MQTNTGDGRTPAHQALTGLALAVLAAVLWAGWLGWDQKRDVHADGTTTGPYEAWQVAGLVLPLLAAVYWTASRQYITATVLGITAGLTGAACYDWSDDSSGLFVIGVTMIMIGSLGATGLLAVTFASRGRRPGGVAGA
ncbi:hypothetical protein ACWDR0_19215 [Streptomyces sp. NPDC003691]